MPGTTVHLLQVWKTGTLGGQVCRQRLARQQGQGNQAFKPKAANECDAAGPGYGDRRDHNRHQAEAKYGTYGQSEVGYVSVLQPTDEVCMYRNVQRQQMEYLCSLEAQASAPSADVQRVPKCGETKHMATNKVQFHAAVFTMDEVSRLCTYTCLKPVQVHGDDVWMEPVTINDRKAIVKIDTGAKVNVM